MKIGGVASNFWSQVIVKAKKTVLKLGPFKRVSYTVRLNLEIQIS